MEQKKPSIREHIHYQLANLPIAITGLALGIAGLTGALTIVFGNTIACIGAGISSILVFLIVIRNILHFRVFITELTHPILGSFIPTLSMSLMVISSVLLPYVPLFARGLWLCAICFHAFILVQFFRFRLREFSIEHVIPSWFIPPVGIIVGCVTSGGMGFPSVATGLFYIGFTAYSILLPIMLYRIMFGDRLTDIQIPSFAIMGAPSNLCLAGLLTVFPEPNPYLVELLAYLGLFTTMFVYIFFVRIFQMSFTPSFSALTFPLAIGATAMIKYSSYLAKIGTSLDVLLFWSIIAYGELIVACVIVGYVFIRIVHFLYCHFFIR